METIFSDLSNENYSEPCEDINLIDNYNLEIEQNTTVHTNEDINNNIIHQNYDDNRTITEPTSCYPNEEQCFIQSI